MVVMTDMPDAHVRRRSHRAETFVANMDTTILEPEEVGR